jgi:hypothetical protein
MFITSSSLVLGAYRGRCDKSGLSVHEKKGGEYVVKIKLLEACGCGFSENSTQIYSKKTIINKSCPCY